MPRNFEDFTLYQDRIGFSGFEGFRNLVCMLRADAKEIVQEYSVKQVDYLFEPNRSKSLLAKIEAVLDKFGSDWFQFANTEYCDLSLKELKAIIYYRIYRNYDKVAELLDIAIGTVYNVIDKALRRLRYSGFMEKYCDWIINKNQDTPEREHLYYLPLYCVRRYLPNSIALPLMLSGAATFGEAIQKVSAKELKRYRGLGKKSVETYLDFLKKHDLIDLLKPDEVD